MICPKCDCPIMHQKVVDSIDNHPTEIEYTCADCGTYVDYMAYGQYNSQSSGHDLTPTQRIENLLLNR